MDYAVIVMVVVRLQTGQVGKHKQTWGVVKASDLESPSPLLSIERKP